MFVKGTNKLREYPSAPSQSHNFISIKTIIGNTIDLGTRGTEERQQIASCIVDKIKESRKGGKQKQVHKRNRCAAPSFEGKKSELLGELKSLRSQWKKQLKGSNTGIIHKEISHDRHSDDLSCSGMKPQFERMRPLMEQQQWLDFKNEYQRLLQKMTTNISQFCRQNIHDKKRTHVDKIPTSTTNQNKSGLNRKDCRRRIHNTEFNKIRQKDRKVSIPATNQIGHDVNDKKTAQMETLQDGPTIRQYDISKSIPLMITSNSRNTPVPPIERNVAVNAHRITSDYNVSAMNWDTTHSEQRVTHKQATECLPKGVNGLTEFPKMLLEIQSLNERIESHPNIPNTYNQWIKDNDMDLNDGCFYADPTPVKYPINYQPNEEAALASMNSSYKFVSYADPSMSNKQTGEAHMQSIPVVNSMMQPRSSNYTDVPFIGEAPSMKSKSETLWHLLEQQQRSSSYTDAPFVGEAPVNNNPYRYPNIQGKKTLANDQPDESCHFTTTFPYGMKLEVSETNGLDR